MIQPDPVRIASAIKSAPAWARLAITSSREHLVDQAADTLAAIITAKLEQPEPADPRQLRLL